MHFIYNIIVPIAYFIIKFLAFFNPKIKLFVNGRKNVFTILQNKISIGNKTIWFHAASLGEYEQGLPIMEKIKNIYPNHKIVLTFFSPSGYEVRKSNTIADVTIYLPMDSKQNAEKFIKIVQPEMAFFIKYEYWPNYLASLKKNNIKTYLVSGIFRKNQVFFKWYGSFYRDALKSFDHFFVQNEISKELLESIGYQNVTISGDTRFDRVNTILKKDNKLDYIENFKNNTTTIVIGSSWPKDELLLTHFINESSNVKFIIAPHNIKAEQIQALNNNISKKVVLFSEKEGKNLSHFDVFIIDTIGLLTKIYSYANIAYIGGGFGNPGIHNILEPAVYGVPIVIGPNYNHFDEAIKLVKAGGCISIKNQDELNKNLSSFILNDNKRNETGRICSAFVESQLGATQLITDYIKNKL